MKDTSVILLAAGASSRMGQPKLALPFGGRTALEHALLAFLQVEDSPVLEIILAVSPQTQDLAAGLANQYGALLPSGSVWGAPPGGIRCSRPYSWPGGMWYASTMGPVPGELVVIQASIQPPAPKVAAWPPSPVGIPYGKRTGPLPSPGRVLVRPRPPSLSRPGL